MVVDMPAEVVLQEQMGPGLYRLTLHAPAICRAAAPGQFVYIRCESALDPFLRRPLSIHGVDRERGEMFLLYQVVGKGSALLAAKEKGDRLAVMGPLGRGFTLPAPGKRVVLVGGGIGVAPLFFLGQELAQRNNRVSFLMGARSAGQLVVGKMERLWGCGEAGRGAGQDNLLAPAEFDRCREEVPAASFTLATDDGSLGHRGPVTDLLERILAEQGTEMVYACGPRGMLRKTAALLARYGVPGEVSLEERMGCGVGACLSCVCKTVGKGVEPFQYRRVCVEGPVFSVEQLIWE